MYFEYAEVSAHGTHRKDANKEAQTAAAEQLAAEQELDDGYSIPDDR